MDVIYEVIDSTNDEMYFTLGIFVSLDDLKDRLITFDKNSAISDSGPNEDVEVIEVKERKIGWGEHGKTVFTITREYEYCEKDDSDSWKITHQA